MLVMANKLSLLNMEVEISISFAGVVIVEIRKQNIELTFDFCLQAARWNRYF